MTESPWQSDLPWVLRRKGVAGVGTYCGVDFREDRRNIIEHYKSPTCWNLVETSGIRYNCHRLQDQIAYLSTRCCTEASFIECEHDHVGYHPMEARSLEPSDLGRLTKVE